MNQEAKLREVLAEVSVLDLWTAMKSIFAQWGCFWVFFIVAAALGNLPSWISGSPAGFGIPDWAFWLFVTWMLVASYTADKSFHEHRFCWYFPKAGWLWSIPLATYIFVGIKLFSVGDPDDSPWIKAAHAGIFFAWWLPFVLAVSILEIGHNRLMNKRSAGSLNQ